MATLNQLLDIFGPPPHDLCRDWLEQLQESSAVNEPSQSASWLSTQARFGKPAAPPNFESSEFKACQSADGADWRNWEVSASGELIVPERCERQVARAVEELQAWLEAAGYDAWPPDEGAADTAVATAPMDPSPHRAPLLGVERNMYPRGRRSSTHWLDMGEWKRRHSFLAISSIVLFVGLIGWLALPQPRGVVRQSSDSDVASLAPKVEETSAAASPLSAQPDSPIYLSGEDAVPENFESLTTAPSMVGSLEDDAWPSDQTIQSLTTSGLAQLVLAETLTPSAASPHVTSQNTAPNVASSVGTALAAEPSPLETLAADATASMSNSAMFADGDTLSDPLSIDAGLAEVMRAAESQAVTSVEGLMNPAAELPNGSNSNDPILTDRSNATITFDRQELLQRIEWPRSVSKRLREKSVWHAELELPTGFIAEPDNAWSIAAGESRTWKVYDATAREPRACLVIELKSGSVRDGGVVCRISGSGDDWPLVHFPLSRKWLDPIRNQIKQVAARLHFVSERTVESLASEMRSLALQQKRQAKESLKYVERLEEIAADNDRLASLLDGECSIKLQLHAAATNAPWPTGSSTDQP